MKGVNYRGHYHKKSVCLTFMSGEYDQQCISSSGISQSHFWQNIYMYETVISVLLHASQGFTLLFRLMGGGDAVPGYGIVVHISSIQQCRCSSNICNIKGDVIQKVGPAKLGYFRSHLG